MVKLITLKPVSSTHKHVLRQDTAVWRFYGSSDNVLHENENHNEYKVN